MARSPSPGRGFLLLAVLLLLVAAAFDLTRPDPVLSSAWRSLFRGSAPVEEIKDGLVRQVNPRR